MIRARDHAGDREQPRITWRVDLVGTYDESDKGLRLGAMASVINYALGVIDELAAAHGESIREDVLELMAAGLPPAAGRQQPG